MLDEGSATVWNANNPSRVIVAGDRILEVNGESMSPEDWNVDTVRVDSICVKGAFSFGSHGGLCMNPGIHWIDASYLGE